MIHGFSDGSAALAAAELGACGKGLASTAPASSPSAQVAGRKPADARLEGWFRDHFDTLWRFAARLGVPRQHVDDVIQEVFITASRRAAEIESGAERRFLISTTIKISANQRRRSARQLDRPGSIEEQPDVARDGAELLERKRLLELFYAALDTLPYDQRSALVLHELEGFTVPQIAELLNVPQGTAASRLARARRAFAKSAERLRDRAPRGEAP